MKTKEIPTLKASDCSKIFRVSSEKGYTWKLWAALTKDTHELVLYYLDDRRNTTADASWCPDTWQLI